MHDQNDVTTQVLKTKRLHCQTLAVATVNGSSEYNIMVIQITLSNM